MRVIFLDFDGVLNTTASLGRRLGSGLRLPDDFTPIDRSKIWLLDLITDRTRASIVISSGWRSMATPERCTRWLREAGATGDILGELGPTKRAQRRGDVIASWLRDHPRVARFVILDDMSKPSMMPVQRRLVQCDPNKGLTLELARRAIDMLQEAP